MENKINIAELLKDCPKGMELDCALFENVTFLRVDMSKRLFPIEIAISGKHSKYLTKEGCFHDISLLPDAKCVIFPKGKTTWDGFVPPYKFKDGDVIFKDNFIAIVSHIKSDGVIWYHCWYNIKSKECKFKNDFGIGRVNDSGEIRLATEEEKVKLFQTIKNNGYRWNAETKSLEKLVEPKFKVGDEVQRKEDIREKRIIDNVLNNCYTVKGYGVILFTDQEEWELVPNKFDITTLKPFESKVLIRDYDDKIWIPTFWGSLLKEDSNCRYLTTGGCYRYCIPYNEETKNLLGTTYDCDEFYKTWK